MNRTTWIVGVVLIVGLATGCGGTPAPACGPSTCRGCCAADGVCESGASDLACGTNGGSCSLCGGATACMAGSCTPRTNVGGGMTSGGSAGGEAGGSAGGASAGGAAAGGSAGGAMAGGSAGGAMAGGSAGGAMAGGSGGGAMAGGSAGGGVAGGSSGGAVAGGSAGGAVAGGSAGGAVAGGSSGGAVAGGSAGGAIGGGVAGGSAGGAVAGGSSGGAVAGGSSGGSVAGGSSGGAVAGGTAGGGAAGGTARTGETCQTALLLPLGVSLAGSTVQATNDFVITSTAGCSTTSSAPDLVYEVSVPPMSTVRVTMNITSSADLDLLAVEAPSSNCGTRVGSNTVGITCVASSASAAVNERVDLSNSTAQAKSFFLIIDGYQSGDSGNFVISATELVRPAGPAELEPNDTRVLADATGQSLSSGSVINGTLDVSEADVFKFVANTAGVLRVEASSFDCVQAASTQLQLLDATGAALYTETSTSEVACRVLVAHVQAGTYYLAVSRTATASNAWPYWLSGRLLPEGSMEVEPNDATSQANLLVDPLTTVCGSIAATGDTADVFLFTLATATNLHAETFEAIPALVRCESGMMSTRLELLSGAGIVLATDSVSGRGTCSRLERALAPGTYFLRVRSAATPAAALSYCLHLKR